VTKKWEDRGRGNLTLRRAKQQPGDSGPNTPFLVFTMESGRCAGFHVLMIAGNTLLTRPVTCADQSHSHDGAELALSLQGAAECEPVQGAVHAAAEGDGAHDAGGRRGVSGAGCKCACLIESSSAQHSSAIAGDQSLRTYVHFPFIWAFCSSVIEQHMGCVLSAAVVTMVPPKLQ
jgi:hypothetical protein